MKACNAVFIIMDEYIIVLYQYPYHVLVGDVSGERIVYLTPNNATNVTAQWAIWMCKAMAVPLCSTHPTSEKQYFIDDTQAKLVIGKMSWCGNHCNQKQAGRSIHRQQWLIVLFIFIGGFVWCHTVTI